jgi:hypothetical protein
MWKSMATAGVGAAAVAALAMAAPAFAGTVPGTTTLTGGTLTMSLPASVTFAGSLTGADQVLSTSQAVDVLDNTGSGSGWNVTLTSTTFTSGSNLFPTSAVTDSAATSACDSGVTCVLGDNTTASYPITIPAAATAPTAVKIQAAKVNTGLGGQTWTHAMKLAVLASARAGTYTSTWTYSLVSAP